MTGTPQVSLATSELVLEYAQEILCLVRLKLLDGPWQFLYPKDRPGHAQAKLPCALSRASVQVHVAWKALQLCAYSQRRVIDG